MTTASTLDDFGKITRPIQGDIMRHCSPVWRWVGGECIRSYRCKHTGRGFRSVAEIMGAHFVGGVE